MASPGEKEVVEAASSDVEVEPVDLTQDAESELESQMSITFRNESGIQQPVKDRSCHNTHDFDEILAASHQDELNCLYCSNYVSADLNQFKNHLLRVHYTFSYSFVIGDQKVCVLACRRGCISRPKQGNRSHFHCPACGRTYGRKPALAHHIRVWKGRCLPIGEMPARSKRHHLRNKIPPPTNHKPMSFQEEILHATAFIDGQFKDRQSSPFGTSPYSVPVPTSAYTVVVEDEGTNSEDAGVASAEPRAEATAAQEFSSTHQDQRSHSQIFDIGHSTRQFSNSTIKAEEDAAEYFGKTVSSRIRSLCPKKQAEAMQKIMQILFEIEYAD